MALAPKRAGKCYDVKERGEHKHHADILATPLGRLPDMMRDTLEAASYHFSLLKEAGQTHLVHEPQGLRTVWSQSDRQKVRWHLRSFFWDLVAAFDLVLVWCNQRFELGIHPRAVTWNCVKDAVSETRPDEWSHALATLSRFEGDATFFEIKAYRNYAHRDFLFGNALVHRTGEMIGLVIPNAREGQGFEKLDQQLPRYLAFVREMLTAVVGSSRE